MPGNATLVSPRVAEEHFGTAERLGAVVARLLRRTDRTPTGAALTPAGTSVLAGIVRQGPLRLSELASAEGMNPTMLSRLVHELEQAGLVTRQTDASDRRASLVEATAAGKRLHGQIRTERSRVLSLALGRLSPSERSAVVNGLAALEALADQLKAPNT
ncbi:MAG TPA: MarR family transcriptional regulator [Acidimicrobiales bacterium]|nr:MarR family transcriptional regulator [Acidimicrobiales bacterium]